MSPTRVFMANVRKLLVIIVCAVTATLYLTYLILNYKDEIRLLEESSLFLKQKQDNLAAQLQVAQEHKSRLQNQVDQSVKSIKTAKDQFETYRVKMKMEQDRTKTDSEKKYDIMKKSFELTKNELDDLTQEHAKLLEANKLTMEVCEKEAEEKNTIIQQLRGQREQDQAAIAKEAKRSKTEVGGLRTKIAALQAINANLKESLSSMKTDMNKLRAEAVSKKNLPQKNINSQANDAFLHSPVNETKVFRKSGDVITKRLDTANTGRHSLNLHVPFIHNNIDDINKYVLPAHLPLDHKDVQNPQIAKPMAVRDAGDADTNVQSPGMQQNPIIPKDQDNIQIAHPWAKGLSRDSHDSGFKVVGQPVLAQPKIGSNEEGGEGLSRNIPFINNNLGVIVEPKLGDEEGRDRKANVIPYGDRDRQVVAPNMGVQVDNPLEAEGNPSSLHQPQLQLNAPDGDGQGNGEGGIDNNDDDEDHAFGNDKDYGAGALDKPDRGNQGGAVDGAAVVGAAPPEFDDQKLAGINVDFKKRKRKFA